LGPKSHFLVTFHSFPRGYPRVPQKDTAISRQKLPEVIGFGVLSGGGGYLEVTLMTFHVLGSLFDDFSIKPSRFAVM
jgi:hypothetical protein